MREDVLDPLLESERQDAESLSNPPPSRSSKSNHLIYDPTVSEKVLTNLVAASQKSPKVNQNPLSPASPAAIKKSRKSATGGSSMAAYYDSFSSGGPSTSEEEEAANELISGLERFSGGNHRSHQQQQPPVYRPVEVLRYPMRSDPGDDIAKIFEDKRHRPHEQDVIHRNRLHTHVLMGKSCAEDERERKMITDLLGSVKIKIETEDASKKTVSPMISNRILSKSRVSTSAPPNDPRSLHDIQESLVSLQTSLLATQNSYKHMMKALKKHHNVLVLPPALPAQIKKLTRRSSERV